MKYGSQESLLKMLASKDTLPGTAKFVLDTPTGPVTLSGVEVRGNKVIIIDDQQAAMEYEYDQAAQFRLDIITEGPNGPDTLSFPLRLASAKKQK